ncbi:MAG: hypothetical protein K2P59_01025 [Acetatifactor sp.]|nr:hypothetical protein [Acetatifactor sp.]
MRIGEGFADYSVRTASRGTGGGRVSNAGSDAVGTTAENTATAGSLLWQMTEGNKDGEPAQDKRISLISGGEDDGETVTDRSEALKVYEEAFKGGVNPIKNLISVPKVPYGHMAKDGVIVYNGVLFTCDERSNSICLGDVSDPKQVINITLSGGGHLKVNRSCLDQLGKAIGMFSPEDVNLIMRAIHQDTKVQSMQKEIEDLEAGVGEQIASGNGVEENDAAEDDTVNDSTAESDKKEDE